jgi:Peptidase family M28
VEHLRALDRIAKQNGGERATGTPGYAASVDYVAAQLRRAGWRVRIQQVPLAVPREGEPARLSIASLGALRSPSEFRTVSYSGSGEGSGRLREVGDGCEASDFAALRPGEVALAQTGTCFTFVKAGNARRAGALALLVTDDTHGHGVPSSTLVSPARLPVLRLRRGIAEGLRPGQRVSLRVKASVERRTTRNVIAEAGEGGPVVMAGAHLDSVPGGAGINDNGSGVATLLEAAEALGSDPPGRVRLGFWGAEELGLHGSRRYVRSLSAAQRREIAAYLNLDMVGSPNAVPAVYSDGDPRVTGVLRRAHPGHEEGVAASGRSDHGPFEEANIPVGGLYTGSEESGPGGRPRDPCYHLPCDTLHNVDRGVLLRMARATLQAVRRLSGHDHPRAAG